MTQTRLLIVDDDTAFRERLAKAFRARSYHTATAATVAEAREQFVQFKPTHAVVDLRIGSCSGLELLDSTTTRGSCRIVILTGYGSISTAMEAVRRGAVNYLTKPVNATDIEQALFEDAPIPETVTSSKELATPSLDEVKWEHLQKVLNDCNGNITHAAERLGLHRQALQRKLKNPPKR